MIPVMAVMESMALRLVATLAFSLALTLLIECALAAILGIRGEGLRAVALVNLVTNPPLVLSLGVAGMRMRDTGALTLLLEALAILIEAALYRRAGERGRPPGGRAWPLVLSILLNAASYGAGVLVTKTMMTLGVAL